MPRILSALLRSAGTPVLEVRGNPETVITGLVDDSRHVKPGDLFAALEGLATDGHAYVGAAVAAGATAVLHEKPLETYEPSVVYLRVPDARALLSALSRGFYGEPGRELVVIGVTGTKGKSSTIFMLSRVLEEAGVKVAVSSSLMFKIKENEWLNPYHMTMSGRFKLQQFLYQAKQAGCTHAIIETTSEGIRQHRHCFINFDDPKTFLADLTLDEIQEMSKHMGNSLINVNLTGGEPLLRKDIFEIAKAYFKNAGIQSLYVTTNGMFTEWTKEFIDAFVLYLKKTLSCPNALILDCGAGNGLLTFWLKKYGFNIVAVDSKSDEWEFTQNGKIPDWVLQMEVSEALEKFQPELVIASWMPPSWGYSLFDNYEWTDNFHSCPSVKEYILIGEESDEGNIPQCGSFYSWEGSPNWPRKDLPQLNALSLSYLDFLQKIERDRKSIICSFKKV